jgi:molybdopterin-containing oxidoreductase family iron-sulfur binding subunit
MADHRARVRPTHVAAVGAAIAARLGVAGVSSPNFEAGESVTRLIEAATRDLRAAGSQGIVVAGDAQPAAVHALCAAINAALGSPGTTVDLVDISDVDSARSDAVAEIVEDIKSGQVDVLFALGVNPVYDLAGDQEFVRGLSTVRTSIHLGLHVDETAKTSTWHVPMTHYLEAWGDGRAYDGTLSVIQPLIAPLYADCKSQVEILALLAGESGLGGYDLVLREWESVIPASFARGWRKVVHDGVLPGTGFASAGTSAVGPLPPLPETATSDAGGFEVQILLDTRVLDGSYANNAWLQETPDLVSKVVWDNVAIMSRATASTLGVTTQLTKGKYYADRVTLSLGGRSVTLPAWITPGVADNTIVVWTGFGRDISTTRERRRRIFFDLDSETDVYADGAVANGVGQNVNALRSGGFDAILTGVSVTREPDRYLVVTTQDHGALETPELQAEIERREPVRTATAEAYRNHEAHFADDLLPGAEEPWEDYPTLWEPRHPNDQPFFKDSPYADNQWAMVIDLNTCTGCNTCLVACQAENNVQVVGKRDVGHGRELSWIRIDRYFVSEGLDIDEAKMVVQPLPCQHCENAPCESVCPVAATVHSPDGTNQMIYNRCIGTRYCANNCPYKVRRFNYFNWSKTLPTTIQMVQNPDVTVRFRGVMEKCSYCIQRIRATNQQVNIEDRAIVDGEVVTACQQACPANAITFGDINDPTSVVSRMKKSDRRYELLAELSVKPRTSYLGRITNPNPELEPRV